MPSGYLRAALLLGTACASVHAPATAQQEDGGDGARRLATVQVNATRRTESLQDVPIAVTALNGQELERAGVSDLRALDNLSPSFNMNSSQSESQGSTLRIRGIGTTGNNIGLESAVGVFLDDVYLSRPGVALGDLVDVEQVEILRGPQGTLFGRNTSAGALVISTKKPNLREMEGFANFTAGNFSLMNVQGGLNIPVAEDKFGVRLTGAYRKRDGYVESDYGPDTSDIDRFLLRGQALWVPTSDMSLRVIADYSETDELCCSPVVSSETGLSGPFTAATGEFFPDGAYSYVGLSPDGVDTSGQQAIDNRTSSAQAFANPVEQWGISGTLEWDLGGVEWTTIASYRDFRGDAVQDLDFVGVSAVAAPGAADGPFYDQIETTSLETRFQGSAFNDRLQWLVGAYYAEEDIEEIYTLTLGPDYSTYIGANLIPFVGTSLGPNPALVFSGGIDAEGDFGSNLYTQSAESAAIFTHNVFSVTDKLDLTVGLRWTDESKDGAFEQLAVPLPRPPFPTHSRMTS